MESEECKHENKECRVDDKKGEKKNPAGSGKKQTDSYWFPLSEGYKRLLLVLWIVSSSIVTGVTIGWNDNPIVVFLFYFIVEFISYLVAIWVYQGFRKANNKKRCSSDGR
ncbi:hypothetical protein [uncultured Bacteroides sp.]|uniref:hypothetical protein n=1 Tax=uncultured Bacteroides sp. TaxID=162156 RepID=UPI0026290973|nr:hypothetical protein [uncultured Bacteroides sp.]